MVTQDMLTQLRAERAQAQPQLDYTIGGSVQSQVNQQLNTKREKNIAHGEQSMQDALHQLRSDQAFASREGLARAHFNQAKETL